MGSRLFLYYNQRLIEKDVNVDADAYIHDGIKAIDQMGLCDEKS